MKSYPKGKDIKTQGDCLVNCYKYKIDYIIKGAAGWDINKYDIWTTDFLAVYKKNREFDGW